jgi:hypothetical protein
MNGGNLTNNDLPAFPCEWDYIRSNRAAANGMTLRDYFAAKALPIVASGSHRSGEDFLRGEYFEHAAHAAYAMADAMLKARATGEAA